MDPKIPQQRQTFAKENFPIRTTLIGDFGFLFVVRTKKDYHFTNPRKKR